MDGGMPALERLFDTFYARVPNDPILAPLFAKMSPDHVKHVAVFVAEVLGGPKTYSQKYGGHAVSYPASSRECPCELYALAPLSAARFRCVKRSPQSNIMMISDLVAAGWTTAC
jgi:hypothetical protein